MAAKTVVMTMLVAVVSIVLICMSGSVSAHTHKTHNVTFSFYESILVPNPTGLVVAEPGGDLTKLQQSVIHCWAVLTFCENRSGYHFLCFQTRPVPLYTTS
jgi:hypothetical protein